jgi:hypothetical protein
MSCSCYEHISEQIRYGRIIIYNDDFYELASKPLVPINHMGEKKDRTRSANAYIILKNGRPMCWSDSGKFPKASKFRVCDGKLQYFEEPTRKKPIWKDIIADNFSLGTIYSQ